MLAVFPTLLTFQMVSPVILRIALGLIFIDFGWAKMRRQRSDKVAFFDSIGLRPGLYFVLAVGAVEILAGLFLLIGLFTQVASLVSSIILAISIYLKKRHPDKFESSLGFLSLALIVSLSLIFTGPGFLSFDLPL